jgi:tetratricopeptide (TPR) repeat protein
MSKLEKLKDKARSLESRDPKAAIAAWQEVIKAQDSGGEPNPDLSIFNRLGDLCVKVRDSAAAADWYDRAVDKYAELGFHNNAIAMCNKVLRNAPGRQTPYLKLAKLYAAKGFMTEAQQHFVTYAERMQKAGKLQQAFAALKEFAEISPESAHLRQLLEDHLRMYGEPRIAHHLMSTPEPPAASPPGDEPAQAGKRKSSNLVFLDLDEPPARRPTDAPPRSPEPDRLRLVSDIMPEPDESLEIESTSLAKDAEAPGAPGMLEGLETTHAEYDDLTEDALSRPSLGEHVRADDVAPMQGLEPTVPEEAEEKVPPRRPPPSPLKIPASPARPAGPPPRVALPKVTPPAPKPAPGVGPRKPEAPKLRPVVPKRPPEPPQVEPPKRKVDVPPLELEPDFDVAETAASHDVDDQPLADEAFSAGRNAGFIDFGLDGVVSQGHEAGSLAFANLDEAPSRATIDELEARIADDPDDPEAHRALGEALIEQGERERGIGELDHAATGYETKGNLDEAQELVGEILRLDPNSVRHRQKQVEYAFKSGAKPRLVDAYLELADTLLRGDLPDKAWAVYQRVVEHDSTNERAKAALAMLAPVATPVPPTREGKVAAKDARMKVRDESEATGDFVDLGAMILEDEMPERDTRMKVAEEEPTGDEERDFHEMLTRFRQGIDENIDEADSQSHYDLGVAFKEMGLLDEAIAEFQKALQAAEAKLKTSEALGACFFEKGAHVVAESVLRGGLDVPAASDRDRLGVLYWLGRALEAQGKRPEARECYGRVSAVDIRFMDVGERVKALARAT